MPYGYEQYRLKKGKSPNTVLHEVKLVRSLLGFINQKYKKTVEPYNIQSIDIKEFLDKERASGIKDSTVNKKLGYIKQWFHYMWEIGEIKNDFMPKFKYSDKLNLETEKILVDYEYLLTKKTEFLRDPNHTLNAKILYIFYMKGMRVRDILQLKIEHFNDCIDHLTLKYHTQSGYPLEITFNEDDELASILAAIERSVFRGVEFILSSKDDNGQYTMFKIGSLSYYIDILSNYTGMPFRSEQVRYAYVHYLYTHKQYNIREIQSIMGISLNTTTRILKESLERVEIIDYTKKRTTN